MQSYLIILVSALLLLITGCKKDNNGAASMDFGYDYYPGEEGSYVEYEVEEISYDDFFDPVKVDTFHYALREILDSSFMDNSARPSLRISRYRKDHDTLSWQLSDVWYATRTEQHLEVVEENLRYIKLAFPLRLFKRWDGNAFNIEPESMFRIDQIDQAELINGVKLDKVLQVVKENERNLIETRYAEEKYARGVGLVYRQEMDVKTEITGEITSGRVLSMKITSYGTQ